MTVPLRRAGLTIGCVLLIHALGVADVLVTKSGSRYQGKVTEQGDSYVLVRAKGGKMTLADAGANPTQKRIDEMLKQFEQRVKKLREPRIITVSPEQRGRFTFLTGTYGAATTIRREIRMMEERLAKNPDSIAVQQRLFRLHLVEADDMAGAEKYLARGGDARSQRLLPLLQKRQPLSRAESLEIGIWYQDLSRGGTPASQYRILRRSANSYWRVWVQSQSRDSLFEQAEARLLNVQKKLKLKRQSLISGERMADYLPLCRPGAHVPLSSASWGRAGLTLKSSPGPEGATKSMIPLAPHGLYEAGVTFARLDDTATIAVIFPTAGGAICLVIGPENVLSVCTSEKAPPKGGVSKPVSVPLGARKFCTLAIQFGQVKAGKVAGVDMWGQVHSSRDAMAPAFAVFINGARVMESFVSEKMLSPGQWSVRPTNAFGIAVATGEVVVNCFLVRSLSSGEPLQLVPTSPPSGRRHPVRPPPIRLPKPKPVPKVTSPQKQAEAKLRLARSYMAGGRKQKAKEVLATVIRGYPGTPAAAEARKTLEELDLEKDGK